MAMGYPGEGESVTGAQGGAQPLTMLLAPRPSGPLPSERARRSWVQTLALLLTNSVALAGTRGQGPRSTASAPR